MLSTGHLEERLKDGKTAFEELEISGGQGSCGVKSISQERTLVLEIKMRLNQNWRVNLGD